MISKFLRRLLGLDLDLEFLIRKLNYESNERDHDMVELRERIKEINSNVRVMNQALGRVIAKIDPMFTKPETPPEMTSEQRNKEWEDRKAESDRLGEEAINRLFAEQEARSKHDYPNGSQGTR